VTSYLEAQTHADNPDPAARDISNVRRSLEEPLTAVLEWLWDTVAGPVLTALGISDVPQSGQPWPRIWWCPTGLLALLPLHAAGYHIPVDGRPPRTVMDRAASSYTPTLSVLASTHHTGGLDPLPATLLFVGIPETPSEPGLDSVKRENDLLARLLKGRSERLIGEHATTSAVRAEIALHRWVHLSCHAYQNLTSPSRGGLRLYDGVLRIADISTAQYGGEFVFLSACQTATGGVALPDEAISVAAALQFAGFRHVVATLWSVYDAAAAEVAERFYADLTTEGELIPTRSAYALHLAVRGQRDLHRTRPSWWTPFIHLGP
jgi:CHAT domain-containing protein